MYEALNRDKWRQVLIWAEGKKKEALEIYFLGGMWIGMNMIIIIDLQHSLIIIGRQVYNHYSFWEWYRGDMNVCCKSLPLIL